MAGVRPGMSKFIRQDIEIDSSKDGKLVIIKHITTKSFPIEYIRKAIATVEEKIKKSAPPSVE